MKTNTEVKSQIKRVFAKLEVNGETELMVLLAMGGAINRKGGMDDEWNPYCIGTTEEDLFALFLDSLSEELFEMAGRYTYPEPKGDLCSLSIAFEGDELDTGFEFVFGSESEGPPAEIMSLLENLLQITDEWYDLERQKRKKNRK